MPIYELGYRPLPPAANSRVPRWFVIASTGIRLLGRSRWLRRMLLFSWLPAIAFGGLFLAWEQYSAYPSTRLPPPVEELFRRRINVDVEKLSGSPEERAESRHYVWSWLLNRYFRYPQGVAMALVVGLVAPPLISQDMRSRAQFLYFSRPLSFLEYLFGKGAIIWFYLASISTAPALCLYLLGVLYSPSFAVVQATWDLPLRILAASAIVILPTSMLALWISSLTEETRYAAFAWFALWILGWSARGIMEMTEGQLAGGVDTGVSSYWNLFSLYHTLGNAQQWVFGFQDFAAVQTSCYLLIALTILPACLLMRRVIKPLTDS